MIKEDFIERQIHLISSTLAKTLFGKEQSFVEIPDPYRNEAANDLSKQLTDLLAEGKINEAENLLFEATDESECVDGDYLRVAIDFYLKLAQYDDAYLETCGFSKIEIDEGWAAYTQNFWVDMLL